MPFLKWMDLGVGKKRKMLMRPQICIVDVWHTVATLMAHSVHHENAFYLSSLIMSVDANAKQANKTTTTAAAAAAAAVTKRSKRSRSE